MPGKVLYVGNFSFPKGSAAGSRVLGNGYLLRDLGYEVIFIGLDKNLPNNSSLSSTHQIYDDFQYYNLPYPEGSKGWLLYRQRYKEVNELVEDENLDIIIIYGSPTLSFFGWLIRNWCRRKKIKFITDVHDWLPSESGGLLFRLVKSLDTTYQLRFMNSSADGVIAISSYLSNFYRKRARKTVIIPPLTNIDYFRHLYRENNINEVLSLIYVGQPFPTNGRSVKKTAYKDRLDKAIEALYELRELEFVFNIYGLTKEQYLAVICTHAEIIKSLEKKVVFHGFIPNTEVINKVSDADFLILFRDVNRMTTAGFPTKVAESISCGTPVIVTNTSDLEKYIEPGVNGYFVDIDNKEKLLVTMKEILLLDRSSISLMKKNCEESRLFSYTNFKNEMNLFLNSL